MYNDYMDVKKFDPIENSPEGRSYLLTGEEKDLGGLQMGKDFQAGFSALEVDYKENEEFRNFVDSLSGREKVLDLGAGLGTHVLTFLQNKGKLGEVYSLDLDSKNLEAQKEISDLENNPQNKQLLLHGEAAQLPLADSSVDIIVQSGLMDDNLENMQNKRTDIDTEMNRVLKPGGDLVLTSIDYKPDPKVFHLQFSLFDGGVEFYKKI